MSDMIRVEFGALQHAGDSINTALRALENQLAELERDAAPLVATWQGDAQQAYQVRQTRWREAAEGLSVMLRDIKRALDESAADYASTENRNTALFGSALTEPGPRVPGGRPIRPSRGSGSPLSGAHGAGGGSACAGRARAALAATAATREQRRRPGRGRRLRAGSSAARAAFATAAGSGERRVTGPGAAGVAPSRLAVTARYGLTMSGAEAARRRGIQGVGRGEESLGHLVGGEARVVLAHERGGARHERGREAGAGVPGVAAAGGRDHVGAGGDEVDVRAGLRGGDPGVVRLYAAHAEHALVRGRVRRAGCRPPACCRRRPPGRASRERA